MTHHAGGGDAVGLLEIGHGSAGLLAVGACDEVLGQIPQLIEAGLHVLHVVALVPVLHDALLYALVHKQVPCALAHLPVGFQVVMLLEADEGRLGDAAEVLRGLVAVHVPQLHEPGLDDGDGGGIVPLLQDLILQGLRDGRGRGRLGGGLRLTDHGQNIPLGGSLGRPHGGPGHVSADHQRDDEQHQRPADGADADLHGLVEALEAGRQIPGACLRLVPQEEDAGLDQLPQLLEQGTDHLPDGLCGGGYGGAHLLAGGANDGPYLQKEGSHRIKGAADGPAEPVPSLHEPLAGRLRFQICPAQGEAELPQGLFLFRLVGLLWGGLLCPGYIQVFVYLLVHTLFTSMDTHFQILSFYLSRPYFSTISGKDGAKKPCPKCKFSAQPGPEMGTFGGN